MKVLFLLGIGLDRPATSSHLLIAVIKAVCEKGHIVHIIQKDTKGDMPSIPKSLSGYPVTTDCVLFDPVNKTNFAARYLNELKYIKNCKKYITTEYDAVFIQSTTNGGFVVKAVRRKLPNAIVTFNVQDVFPYNLVYSGGLKERSIVFKILAGFQRYGYKHSDHIITISEDMKDLLVEDGTPAEKIEVVYNWSYQDEPYKGIDLAPVAQMFNKDFFNVVYAGNIGIMQNVEIIIEAARLMKDDKSIWFHIIGNGVYKEKLEQKARAYQISSISFWPMQPPESAPLIYTAADVNIIPLVKDVYKTALPSKTATCLACGKPVIFAIGKESSFGRMVSKETGCIVTDSCDTWQLVRAIRAVQSGNDGGCDAKEFFRKNMGITENSRKYADIITTKVM